MKKRVFIYCRVSTREQAEEGYSIGEQEERLIKYCEAMGWQVVKVFVDPGYTGSNMERPALQQMIEEIRRGGADIVLVDKLDRLSRSQFDTLYLITKIFTEHNTAFVSRAEAFDTSTPFGRAMVGILAVFAELERERIKERMSDGKAGRAKEGLYKGGGNVPIGYDYDGASGALEINEYEALQIKEVFEMCANRVPFYTMATIMNEKGYRTKYGNWKKATFRTLLKNPVYIGKISHKDELYKGKHDAIISEELFESVQKILEERNRDNDKYKPGKRYSSPLGGMVWCGHCGGKYHWRINGKNKTGYRAYYICYSRAKSDKNLIKDPNCKNRTYRDRDLEKIIYDEIRKLKSDPVYLTEIADSLDNSGRQTSITERINKINEQISKFMDLYSIGGMDIEMIKSKIEPLNAEKTGLEKELESLKEESAPPSETDIINLVEDFNSAIEENNCYKIHDIIAELIDHIVINGDNVEIHWAF